MHFNEKPMIFSGHVSFEGLYLKLSSQNDSQIARLHEWGNKGGLEIGI